MRSQIASARIESESFSPARNVKLGTQSRRSPLVPGLHNLQKISGFRLLQRVEKPSCAQVYSERWEKAFLPAACLTFIRQRPLQDAVVCTLICEESARAHFKGAMQFRNRHMVDRADLIVCYIEHNEGGAYQTVQYAKKQDKKIINLAELEEE